MTFSITDRIHLPVVKGAVLVQLGKISFEQSATSRHWLRHSQGGNCKSSEYDELHVDLVLVIGLGIV
jgi:hypothetical protein